MTRAQEKQVDRDWPLVALTRSVVDVMAGVQNPTPDELYTIELERDRLTRYIDKHADRETL